MKIQNNTFRYQACLTNIEHRVYSKSINLLSKIFPNKKSIVEGFRTSLLTHGINGKYKGWSLLHLCAYYYNSIQYNSKYFRFADPEQFPALEELINLLMDNNADVNIQDDLGRTPIYFTGNEDMIKALLNKYALLSNNNANVTSLHVLSSHVHTYIIDHIINGADSYMIDKFGRLPLHLAAANYFTSDDPSECYNINALIHYAPLSVIVKDRFGHYPLFYALIFGSNAAVDILLQESPHSVLEEVVTSLENNTFNRKQLDEHLELHNAIYNIDPEFKLYYGGSRKKPKLTSAKIRDIAEQKKKNETFTHENVVYYIHPDEHGIKHTKLSKVMTSAAKNKKITTKEFIAKYRNQPATFNAAYAENYRIKLSEVIKHSVLCGDFENGVTVFDMGEVVGWDQAKPTQFIELYYNGVIGSHMRPKAQD